MSGIREMAGGGVFFSGGASERDFFAGASERDLSHSFPLKKTPPPFHIPTTHLLYLWMDTIL